MLAFSGRAQAGQQRTMTKVHAIEVADGQRRGIRSGSSKTAINEHRRKVSSENGKSLNYNGFSRLLAGAGFMDEAGYRCCPIKNSDRRNWLILSGV